MFKNKKLLFAASLVTLGVIISGCSSNTAAPTVTVTEEAPVQQLTPEEQYLRSLHAINNYYIENNSDRDLLELGYSVCGVFDQGYSAEDIVSELLYGSFGAEHGDDPSAIEFAGATLGAAVANLCPEYLAEVQDLVYG